MRTDHGHDVGGALVSAACSGDPRAVEGLVARSLPLVYNIVGRALDGHQDVDDVVQETLLRLVRGLNQLEDPSAYRSWMVAITVRQIRDWIRRRQQDRRTHEPMDRAAQVPDPASDFASLTVLRLQLDDSRREVVEATRWLDEDNRELLSLWWLEETGQLTRAEVGAALGLSGRHTAVRIQRLKEQLDVGRAIVRARAAQPPCPDLAELTATWDTRPSPLWRKRIARHLRGCGHCGGRPGELVPVARLLLGLPLLVPPAGLHRATMAAIAAGPRPAGPAGEPPAAGSSGAGDPHPGADAPAPAAARADAPSGRRPGGARPAGRAGHRRRARTPRRRGRAVTAAVATATVLLGVWALLPSRDTGAGTAAAGGAPRPVALTASPSPRPATTTPSPRPTATRKKPKPSPSATAAAKRSARPTAAAAPAATAPAVASHRKGVGVWSYPGASDALARSGTGWYYTWSAAHPGVSTPAGADFVPMIWGADSVTPQNLSAAEAAGPYLLGFNEPDMSAQSNMTVNRALELWPRLESAGRTLGSPAVAYGADRPGGWLDRFMTGAGQRGYRVDFIALHWYGGDFRTQAAVDQLRTYLTAVHERYHKPIWLTEFALIDFSRGTRYPTDEEQAAFLSSATRMLAGLSFLQRYAWFGLGTDGSGPGTTLFRAGSTPTPEGLAFRSAP
ncbi:sigma-70 family RNA polymerase sigma factor [Streptomyces sp. TG1A-8]|uniref:sigma-70 family RNA polymerase sigma factor n=1 Tax=Streptomyces sp. TG1A-8 TaxID=3051385 RepID=UPI00265BCBC5|nr:sigma-70 family RNA polymerase sigma factor [Streptomyces sp. TG1A-8]MDO0926708.1 sigma-70 family RNA polymerase sigma factor [Streptomyces sp. TG1A-8]